MSEMNGYVHDPDRKIIPRWRSFSDTVRHGELGPVTSVQRKQEDSIDFLTSKVDDWRRFKTKAHACDVVGCAVVLGRQAEAVDAAKFLISRRDNFGPWQDDLASRILFAEQYDSSEILTPSDVDRVELHNQIRKLRRLLHVQPRDPIRWVDLALAYTVLGLQKKAEQSMNVALGLARDNRFVLRSATRLWIHLDDVARAHNILVRSDVTKYDPWLLAAEIATAEAASRVPRFTKISRKMLNNDRLKDWHISELASALATLELGSGNVKQARKYFVRSLEAPTENSIAQAAWVSRRGYTIGFKETHIDLPNTYEARSWTYYEKSNWVLDLEYCRLWQFDQPFSSRPGMHGSFVSAVALGDYMQSKEFAERGLIANPRDPILLNNLAFAQINLGQIDAARTTLSRINRSELSRYENTTIKATQGLLEFRNGDIDVGRKLYKQAINDAKKSKSKRLISLALTFYAMEELSFDKDEGHKLAAQAIDAVGRVRDPCIAQLRDKLKTLSVDERPSKSVHKPEVL